MNKNKTERKKLKNHIVQSAYLAQWNRKDENFFCLYIIKDNLIKEKVNSDWRGFWRKGFNVLNQDIFPTDEYNYPEKYTNYIDTPGINVIKSINTIDQRRLDKTEWTNLSLYVALQYFRTPKFRDELESIKELVVREFSNNEEKIPKIDKFVPDKHMEFILKIEKIAKKIFKFRWVFLLTPRQSSFVTSDSPCFIMGNNGSNKNKGFISPDINIIFPLRPDICLMINNDKEQDQIFFKLDKRGVKEVNQVILENAYSAVVARNLEHLTSLTKGFDYKNHKPCRKASIQEFDDYIKIDMR